MSQVEVKSENFGNWMYLNSPRELRKGKHSELVKYLFKLYKKEIASLGLRGFTRKQLLKEVFLKKELHKPIVIEPKVVKSPPLPNYAKKRKRIIKRAKGQIYPESFYLTDEWLSLKNKVHKLYKCGCMKCGVTGVETHVDHIFPRSTYPEFELSVHNLQILCRKCNMEKSNINTTDYRTEEQKRLCRNKFN